MIKIKKNFIYDENRKLLAVQMPIEEYKKLEEIIENHVLSKLIDEVTGDDVLDVKGAKDFYKTLRKK